MPSTDRRSVEQDGAMRAPCKSLCAVVKDGTEGTSIGLATFDSLTLTLSSTVFVEPASAGGRNLALLEAAVIQAGPDERVFVSAYDNDSATVTEKVLELLERCVPNVKVSGTKMVKDFSVESLLSEDEARKLPVDRQDLASLAMMTLASALKLGCESSFYRRCSLSRLKCDAFLRLDQAALTALHVLPTTTTGVGQSGKSLVGLLGASIRSKGGQRRIAQWARNPLVDIKEIRNRHDIVGYLLHCDALRNALLRRHLKTIPDLDRLRIKMVQVSSKQGRGHDRISLEELVRMYECLASTQDIAAEIQNTPAPSPEAQQAVEEQFVKPMNGCVHSCDRFMDLMEKCIDFEAIARDREFRIRSGITPQLEELSQHRDAAKEEMESIRQEVSRKIKTEAKLAEAAAPHYWCLRVPKKQQAAVEKTRAYKKVQINKAEFLFTSGPLELAVGRFMDAQSRYVKPTYTEASDKNLYNEAASDIQKRTVEVAATYHPAVARLADILASLDVLCSFACCALTHRMVRAEIDESSPPACIDVDGARHVLVEEARINGDIRMDEAMGEFVPNDVKMQREGTDRPDGRNGRVMVITGPNMGGKSTYIRTAALCVFLNQIGSFVPAERARLGIFRSIMCRVGASDYQIRGVSTFMAEMLDAASIIQSADEHSLVIIDELGRGTSTEDGFGLAWHITKYIAAESRSFVLFATHFHELATLASTFPNGVVSNAHVAAAVDEQTGKITFLYSIRPGPTTQSYGMNVARLAGFPEEVVASAEARASGLSAVTDKVIKQLLLRHLAEVSESRDEFIEKAHLLRV
ncbi:MutS-like protein [Perkinsus olseni]|uniref:MutS-like protein n=1 Tax=Perkinsus olseni TaxID=32597 RepID=A0A7J6M2J4_PEROL|nr:MutS-like protein [Perkinsus olseni]